MKCLLCPLVIDELKSFPPMPGPNGTMIEDIMGKWKHSQDLQRWTHVALTAQIGGGSMSILSGHICPGHLVTPGSVALAAAPEVPTHKSASDGKPPTTTLKPEPSIVTGSTTTATVIPKGKDK